MNPQMRSARGVISKAKKQHLAAIILLEIQVKVLISNKMATQ
jgi:hypothetical protein